MENNIVVISLDEKYIKNLSKKIAKLLKYTFVDTKKIFANSLQKFDLLQQINKKTIKNSQNATIKQIFEQNRQLIFCTIEIINTSKNLDIIQKKAKIIYFRYPKKLIFKNKFSYNMGYAFDTEDKFCQNICDLTINCKKNATIDEIIEKVRHIYDKESKWQ